MNVYDFDKTIFTRDSSVCFYLYALRKRPAIMKLWPVQIKGVLSYKLGKCCRDSAKNAVMSYFSLLPDWEELVESFWDENIKHIAPWYIDAHREDDLIITASARQIVESACRRLKIKNLIACAMDSATGELLEPNTKGAEKVKKFRELYGAAEIEKFYSDSYSDAPLAEIARESFMVKRGKPQPWKFI